MRVLLALFLFLPTACILDLHPVYECRHVWGKTFGSTDPWMCEREYGKDAPECQSSISFGDGLFELVTFDGVEVGELDCSGNQLWGDGDKRGSYDPENGTLFWDHVSYRERRR